MREKRRFRFLTAIVLVLQLLVLPLAAAAEESGTLPSANEETKPSVTLNAKMLDEMSPKKVLNKEMDMYDPAEYPLIAKGGFVASLYDSYYTKQSFFYKDTESYSTDQMRVLLDYYSDYGYSKDEYFCVEFYKDYQGTLNYEDGGYFDTYGDTSLYLGAPLSKATFANQQYLYIRVGVTDDLDSDYYSDAVSFRVTNPFYTGGGSSTGDSFALISNESINAEATQPTGTFSLNNKSITYSQNLKPSAYQIDYLKPFDPSASKGGLVNKNTKSILPSYTVGATKYFWAANLVTDSYESINARLAYSGTKANIWVNASEINDSQAAQLGREFESKIYTSVTNNFGKESDVNSDGKIDILCYDIRDGFSGSGPFVGGYFYSGDLYNDTYSNKSEIFYIDTYPLMGSNSDDVTAAYDTLAHEFQHMVNYNQNVLVEGGDEMPVWLNEGLSMAAEQIYSGTGLSDRLSYYNNAQSIANGHSLLYWDYNGDTLANYSLSYLFGQYLKIQANKGDSIFKEILTDPSNNYRAVENVAKKYINSSMTIGKLMTSFRAALLVKEPFGLNGFKGNSFFNALKPITYAGSSASLRGGGAIAVRYDSTQGFNEPSSKGANITYTYLKEGQSGDNVPPGRPYVYPVGDADLQLTGVAEANSEVFAKVGSTEIGRTTTGSNGQFAMTIPKQRAGTTIYVYAQDSTGNLSQPNAAQVLDQTAPAAPTVSEVSEVDLQVTGTAEANSTIKVTAAGKLIGVPVKANAYRNFTIDIPAQAAGTVLSVTATDPEGNESAPSTVTVKGEVAIPGITGVANGGSYNRSVTISYDGTATLNWVNADGIPQDRPVYSGITLGEEGVYTLAVTHADSTVGEVKFIIDKTAPLVNGVDVGASYNHDIVISFNEGSATLNGKPFVSGSMIKAQGNYSLIVRDKAGNRTTSTFSIDKMAPVISGVANNALYNKDVTVTFNEGTGELFKGTVTIGAGTSFTSGMTLRDNGNYTLVVTDPAGNMTTVLFTIDKTAPVVSGVVNNGNYNRDVRIYFNEGTATLNGAAFASGTLDSAAKSYTLIVVDKAGNKTTVVFKIDKTAPVVSGVASGKFYNKDTRVYFNEGKATLNGVAFASGGLVSVAKAYTLIVVDSAGNKTIVTFTIDKTPPAAPRVNAVKRTYTSVTGTAEAYSVITIKVGTKVIGTVTSDKYGKFKVAIAAQKRSTALYTTAKDRAGNISSATRTVVQ